MLPQITISPSCSTDQFVERHIGPRQAEIKKMLEVVGYHALSELIDAVVPTRIRLKRPLALPPPISEADALKRMRSLAAKNHVYRSFIGLGYYNCHVPPVIQRNILENPGWYTQYTPYQAEISQGRLEALLNFQTMVSDLTGLPVANASLLDEGTAAAEAMNMAFASRNKDESNIFFVSNDCHPQTIAVVKTRAEPLGIDVVVGHHGMASFASPCPFGLLLQYPSTTGEVADLSSLIADARRAGTTVALACDLLALTLIKSPGDLGADIAIGSAQRFGVPMGYGGPHAGFLAARDEYKRKIPGRIIGMSKDANGKPALRMALQTREQHIRRDKATSNICTSQVLLAIMASMYAVYHGPERLKNIASRIHGLTCLLKRGLEKMGHTVVHQVYFDTLLVDLGAANLDAILKAAEERRINLRVHDKKRISVALDEATELDDVKDLLNVFAVSAAKALMSSDLGSESEVAIPANLRRATPFLRHPVFNNYHSETKMLRYIRSLEAKDLSLTRSMIPLGSCTMKLNATSELMPISWPEFNGLHPFVPQDQAQGYQDLFRELEKALAECTGFAAVSLQPNSGAQGEFTGLMVLRRYHHIRGQSHRNICLIPRSAHGTNPASAVMAGMKVVVVDCDEHGNVDVDDLARKAEENASNLAALMVTYPSTHGVFEEKIVEICDIVHRYGGQVYMDGANMNAQIGLCKPGDFGPDVCHLNLHKTFCIPHGGGGPGVGPIAVKEHLADYLPGHPIVNLGPGHTSGPVTAAPWGSASILPISLMYIWMMGGEGLTLATQVAILNANYIAKRLQPHFPVLYRGPAGLVAHECIVDLRPLKGKTGVEVEDVAKRLMDYGFHAPTVSFPVPGTLMIEPTESEGLDELDRFCEVMIAIREEIREIETGKASREDNPLKNAPHTADVLVEETWNHPYSRARAVFPTEWVRRTKFWPAVSRIDSAFGDRNLVCSCIDS